MKIKAKYIGIDRADIRHGEIYTAVTVADDDRFYGIVDRSGEMYAYPKTLFEVLQDDSFTEDEQNSEYENEKCYLYIHDDENIEN